MSVRHPHSAIVPSRPIPGIAGCAASFSHRGFLRVHAFLNSLSRTARLCTVSAVQGHLSRKRIPVRFRERSLASLSMGQKALTARSSPTAGGVAPASSPALLGPIRPFQLAAGVPLTPIARSRGGSAADPRQLISTVAA